MNNPDETMSGETVMEQQSHTIDKAIGRQQVLLEGYRDLLAILHRPGNVQKQELNGVIVETLKKHNEI